MGELIAMKPQTVQVEEPVLEKTKILVIGSGVAGVKCSFALADLGYQVIIQDFKPYLGGKISKLYKQFPTDDCGWCKMLPQFWRGDCTETCLRRNIQHKNIRFFPYSKIMSVKGEKEEGFDIRVHRRTRFVDESKCIGCGLCVKECPIEVPDNYNENQTKRKAIWMRNGGPVPRVVTLDIDSCTKCGKCIAICPTKAIDLNLKDKEEDIKVNAVVFATGYEEAIPELTEYGYGKYPNVLINMELERMMSGDGLGGVNFSKKDVGILQCVGSRSEKNDYCSSACCMYALKEAMMIKKTFPDCNLTIYYMDMRTFGKDYYRYQKEAESMGIRFVLCRVPSVDRGEQGKVSVNWTDEADIHSEELDYVILSIGQRIPEATKELIRQFGLKYDTYGFIETSVMKPVNTSKAGVYVCGSASGPKDIPDSVTEALAVAAQVTVEHPLSDVDLKVEPNIEIRNEIEPRIAVLLCSCGVSKESSGPVLDKIVENIKTTKGVVVAEKLDLLCQPEQREKVKSMLNDNKITRVLVAACAPYQYQSLFETLVSSCNIDTQMLEIADIREMGFWTGADQRKIQSQVMSGLSRLYAKRHVEEKPIKITQRVLVIGGGLGGLNAALMLSKKDVKVDIVEKGNDLGGNLHKISKTIDGTDIAKNIKEIISELKSQSNITVFCDSEITSVSGYLGQFTAHIKGKEQTHTEIYGSVIIATGGNEYNPIEFEYGKDKRIVTQSEFDKILNSEQGKIPKNVVMIQCVGSRDETHPYCSRICCQEAIKNALALKKKHHDAGVYIIHRDIMTYGLYEKYYTEARKSGINFIRCNYEDKPQVIVDKELTVNVKDKVLNKVIKVKPDLVVLSAGIVPSEIDNIARGLNIVLDSDGFVNVANIKFRPVDTLRDGVFVCGLAHSPRNVSETLVQSYATGVQAINVLTGKNIVRPVISEVNERWCIACEMCISACPYGARVMDEDKKIAKVIGPLCRGCGVCAVVCPSESSRIVGFRRKDVMDQIDSILES